MIFINIYQNLISNLNKQDHEKSPICYRSYFDYRLVVGRICLQCWWSNSYPFGACSGINYFITDSQRSMILG